MYTDKGRDKPETAIKDVENALDYLLCKLRDGASDRELAHAEELVNTTVLAFVRYRAHCNFHYSDPMRARHCSSDLAAVILQRIYLARNLPKLLQDLKDKQNEEAKLACIKWLNKMVSRGSQNIPKDWSRKKMAETCPDFDSHLANTHKKTDFRSNPQAQVSVNEIMELIEQMVESSMS